MKDYPHIKDTVYPDLDTVDVYKIENKFDYSRWGVGTQVKLCNVLFNADYADVVKFDDDVVRDAYFDALDGRVVTLQTAFQQVPRDAIKIPIPYDSAVRYNYLYIDIPTPTSDAQPIDRVAADRIKRYYFFISDIEQLAPNTSKVSIVLDVWTTYINDVSIPYMMLERGHAPVAATDVDTFLDNPRANSTYLLASDVNYGDIDNVAGASWVPIGNGEKYVCFACTYSITQLQSVAVGTDLAATTPATFADETGRHGYRMAVGGYNFGMGGVDFSDVETPVQAYNVGYRADVPSLFSYAIKADGARAFFDYLSRRAPHVLSSVQACFVLGDDVAQFYDSFDFHGHTLHKVAPREVTAKIELDRNMFNYDESYSRFAKLYTYPYAVLEVSDNNGSSFQIRVEDVTNASHLQINLALAYPYLQYQVAAMNIAGYGASSFRWGRIDNQTANVDMPVCDFANYMIQWDVPTYALFERGYDAYRLNQFQSTQMQRQSAITQYRMTQRSANVNDANTHDTNATNIANTANTQNTNVTNSNLAIATANANRAISLTCSDDNLLNIQAQQRANRTSDESLMDQSVEANNEYARMQTYIQQTQNGQNAAEGALSGLMRGDLVGAVFSAGNGITGNLAAQLSYQAGANLAALTTALTKAQIEEKLLTAITTETNNYSNTSYMGDQILAANNTLQSNQVSNNRTTANTNAANTANTSNSNADYTRNTSQQNNQGAMSLTQANANAQYAGARTQQQMQIGGFAGDATLDARQRRGVSVRVKTQRKSDIAQTAAQFARYGYNLNQVWDMSNGFNLMRNFTYWKAADAWVNDDKGTPNTVQLDIQMILTQGVTVWSDPDMIGKVSVYDN